MKWIKRLLIGLLSMVAGLALLAGVTVFALGYADGPTAIIPGGAFSSGELVTEEPDWGFVKEVQEVQFQLLDPVSSRTSWIAEHNGRVFIPSGYMRTNFGKLWKKWPYYALEDPRAILRIDEKLYERRLVRITEQDPDVPFVLAELSRKYLGNVAVSLDEVSSGNTWIFELVPR